jgi:site-specific DNA-methyltransferase (adenine-specific)
MTIELNQIYLMDCLEGMKHIPAGSIDLVLCDPPYGTVKGMAIDGWVNKGEKCDWDNNLNHKMLFEEYNRILRTNGCLILFGQEPFTSNLILNAHGNLPFSYRMVWIKDHFANALLCKKAPVSYFEDILVFFKKYDTLAQHPLREYAKKILEYANLKPKQINELLKHQKADHFFRINSTQFELCTEKVYNELTEKLNIRNMQGYLAYSDLFSKDRKFSRKFNLEAQKFKPNVLSFKKDYTGLHPTQKPVALCEHLIKTYTDENDTVLDNCMGSGTTAIACLNTNRKYIGFEKEPKYFAVAQERINKHIKENEHRRP